MPKKFYQVAWWRASHSCDFTFNFLDEEKAKAFCARVNKYASDTGRINDVARLGERLFMDTVNLDELFL